MLANLAGRTQPKLWKAGIADEAWKVIICARDAYDTEQLISALIYVLTSAGSNANLGLAEIRKMSGDDIVSALLAHVETSRKSVERALRLGVE